MYGLEFGSAPGSITTPTISSSAGGAWTAGPLIKAANVSGCLASWWRYNASAPGAHTVTVTRTEVGSAAIVLVTKVITGTDTTLTGAASQNINATTQGTTVQNVTPVRANSMIAVSAAVNSALTFVANGNTTQWNNDSDSTIGGTIAHGRGTSLTGAAGVAQSLGWTVTSTGNQLWIAQEVWPAAAAAVAAPGIATRDRPLKIRVFR